jgi:hypothetical protein
MNKIFLSLLYAALICALMTSCKKDSKDDDVTPANNTDTTSTDTTPPVITLNGSSSVIVTLNGTYTDAGATANDAHDGTVTVSSNVSSTNPNVDSTDTYTIIYTAQDSTGNIAHATRTILVRNSAYYLEGTYDVIADGTDHYTQIISCHPTNNNIILFSRFANYSNNSSIFANINGTNLQVTTQQADGIGQYGCTHTFNGMGQSSIIINSSKASFTIQFEDIQAAGGGNCGYATGIFSDAYTQQ